MLDTRAKVKLSEWIKTFPPGSRPNRSTVVRWIHEGIIEGVQIGPPGQNGKRGGNWYVYTEKKPSDNQKLNELLAEFEQEALNYEYGKAT